MKRSDTFWDRVAEKYSRSPVPDEALYQHKLAVTQRYLNDDSEVLEIGCGTGTTAVHHAPFAKNIRAIDLSKNMISIAREHAREAGVDNVQFEVARVDELQVDDESVDVVLALSILHLLDDREVAINDAYRMIKPGGVLVSSTACVGDYLKVIKFIAPIGRFLGVMPLLRIFTSADLRASMIKAGFELDYEYQPKKKDALFLVAKKAA